MLDAGISGQFISYDTHDEDAEPKFALTLNEYVDAYIVTDWTNENLSSLISWTLAELEWKNECYKTARTQQSYFVEEHLFKVTLKLRILFGNDAALLKLTSTKPEWAR